ncbi:hypothetical protein CONLIGDRAFT_634153 [Coniochaeta ligniaria NRRL 30616]|uniref:Uncharacterized protein n=1 Tax=Coniochaeta ligniaria NRRL 30616 TaxID=1408157 RepID=A0A1J7IK89_9PEZI|nr:hypothetical protein CONLIGDRAFT_634153 [Coniochaeta ligniaria NRRL 30616]
MHPSAVKNDSVSWTTMMLHFLSCKSNKCYRRRLLKGCSYCIRVSHFVNLSWHQAM